MILPSILATRYEDRPFPALISLETDRLDAVRMQIVHTSNRSLLNS
jgi:hypothetical protein